MSVPGLWYFSDYVSATEEAALLNSIDSEPWRHDLKRRVQHYGYRYDYTTRSVDPSMQLGPIPQWVQSLASKIHTDGHMPTLPDQLIVNEYDPGQGINPHIDSVKSFGPAVCSVTLGSHCVMEMSPVEGGKMEKILVERRSLLVLIGDARYKWRHGIQPIKADTIGGQMLARGRRVSLTFRTAIPGGQAERNSPGQ